MDKTQFVAEIAVELKQRGFKKRRTYWYRDTQELLQCVFVQGSQWDKDNYYVEIGWALKSQENNYPTLLKWYARARCFGKNGDLNMLPSEFYPYIGKRYSQITTISDLDAFLSGTNARYVVSWYGFPEAALLENGETGRPVRYP